MQRYLGVILAGCALLLLWSGWFTLPAPAAYAVETARPKVETAASDSDPARQLAQLQLLDIARQIPQLRDEIKRLDESPRSAEITELSLQKRSELDTLTGTFERLATQLSAEDLSQKEETKLDWNAAIQELLLPLFQAVKDLSSQPRKVEEMKARVKALDERLKLYEEARQRLTHLAAQPPPADAAAGEGLKEYQLQLVLLQKKYDSAIPRLQLDEAKRLLGSLQADNKTILDYLLDSISDFFRVRGLNFLLAAMSFLGVWWVLAKFYKFVINNPATLDRLNPQFGKVIKTFFFGFALTVSVCASMVVLYLRHDWLLLSIGGLFLLALAWASRQFIPGFIRELLLVLNLGSVREGERLVWHGVPWLVKEISMSAALVNERLEGGTMLLPLRDLLNHHSRPIVAKELWFPTRTGDWALLADGTFGQVITQTVEQVILETKGSQQCYPLAEFLNQKPRNLSTGFGLMIEFGLDYGLQARIAEEIPALFAAELKQRLRRRLEAAPPHLQMLAVSFNKAEASSLNLIVTAQAPGERAGDYYLLQREIHKALVQICNDHSFSIPFNQLTLNIAKNGSPDQPGK